jgi:hypothetical protein
VLPLVVALSSCVSLDDRIVNRDFPDDPEPESLIRDMDGGFGIDSDAGLPSSDPHALLGISPNHGPFNGGQTVLLRGNGFRSDVQVWFGESSGEGTISVDPNRVQTTTPPGAAGPVDVIVQNGDDESTRRVLEDGYEYDAFIVDPAAGPTTGGTLLTLSSTDGEWNDDVEVLIDLEPCVVESVRRLESGLYEITCRTPPGTPGQKVVTVEKEDGERVSVAGAFAYSDYASNLEGGLSGDPLAQTLEVMVASGLTGEALPAATVLLGSGFDSERAKQTNEHGIARFDAGSSLGSVETVTALYPCMHPLTLVDVPVDTVRVFLEPVFTPECVPPEFGDFPLGGGAGAASSHRVSGELVWGEGLELRPGPWYNVGSPAHDLEQQIAYIFELTTSSDSSFTLPSRFGAVDHDDRGTYGYVFDYDTRTLGNVTLYALAGIEDRSVNPSRFTPYAMGILRGVDASAEPTGLLMEMNIPLDHELAIEVEPPIATELGPDRVAVEIALRMGASGYVRLPGMQRQQLVGDSSPIRFVGVPALSGVLERAEYLARVDAVSGPEGNLPSSHIDLLSTRQTDTPIRVGDFVPVPILEVPSRGASWDADRLQVRFEPGSDFDLLRFDVLMTKAATTWRIIAPSDRREIDLPDLAAAGFPLPSGNITVGVAAARLHDFAYGSLKEREFRSGAWDAFATNAIPAVLP